MNTTRKSSKHLDDHVIEQFINQTNDKELMVETDDHLHLESCVFCQTRLESLAAEPWMWREASSVLVAAQELLSNEETHFVSEPEAKISTASETVIPKGLLDKPSHPEMLGRLGEHEIERTLGSGGMGIVFKGFDSELNRPVAIKVLAPRFSTIGVARKRFSREARAAAAICHENVVSIHRIDTANQNPFIVMPFVGGGSLQEFVDRDGPPDAVEIVQIGRQIAAGLAAAHEVGVIHRDVKPANILLENGCNRVLITDFGLAQVESDVSLTRSGMIAGTPFYMSPEQARGQSTGAQSDLFALGGTLYFLATGRPPFTAPNAMAVLNKICQDTPDDVRIMNPSIPSSLANVIHTLLEKNPDHRFKSASQVEQLLTEYLAHMQQPMVNRKPLISIPRSTRKRRTRWWLGGLVATLIFAIVFSAGAWMMNPDSGLTNGPGKSVSPTNAIGLSDATMDGILLEISKELRDVEIESWVIGDLDQLSIDEDAVEINNIKTKIRSMEEDDMSDRSRINQRSQNNGKTLPHQSNQFPPVNLESNTSQNSNK